MTEATAKFRLTPRQKTLLPILMCGAFFEGFDWMVINLALPFISRDMNIDVKFTGLALSIVAIGTLVAFFVVRTGDRLGRKPVFLGAVFLYSVLSLATAFAPNIEYFVICQFLARVFLVAEWATGLIIVSEEFPVEHRGRALTLFQSAAAIGAIFPSVLMPIVAATSLGWRALYIIGALPLVIILLRGRAFPETARFEAAKASTETKPGMFAVFAKPYRKHILTVAGLWFFVYLCYAATMSFFSYHVINDLGWDEKRLGLTTAVSYLLGLFGYLLAGKLLDSIGRKATAAIFFTGGAIGTILSFQTTSYPVVFGSLIVGTFFVSVFVVICATFTNELFPTAIRANATAWGNNIVGRMAQILAPSAVGFLAIPLGGIKNSVTIMALGPIVAVVLVYLFLPETKGREIDDTISH